MTDRKKTQKERDEDARRRLRDTLERRLDKLLAAADARANPITPPQEEKE